MGRYKYTQEEKGRNKVLKMNKLLSEKTEKQQKENNKIVETHIEESERLLKELGYEVGSHSHKEQDEKIEKKYIIEESWEELVIKANKELPDDVILEELLSGEEFQKSIDDIRSIEQDFAAKIRLDKTDLIFLLIATAIQTVKWVLLPEIGEPIDSDSRISHTDGDKQVKSDKKSYAKKHENWDTSKDVQGSRGRAAEGKSWKEIIFSSVPYDATAGSPKFKINMEGGYHRYKTLGHDPVLGWIFGTMNILTDTITLNNFNSYRVNKMKFVSENVSMLNIASETYETISDDYHRLPAAIFRQGIHLKSDKYTKLGLPVPVLGVFSEKWAGKLYRNQYDNLCLARDLKTIGLSITVSSMINMCIGLFHGLFYKPNQGYSKDQYEARTRKILLYSNLIATTSNVIFVCITENPKKLDIGGLIVTITRMFSDIRFITKLKQEFIEAKLDEGLMKEIEETDRLYSEIFEK